MKVTHDIIEQVERFAGAVGVTPSALCRAASGNPRLWERMKRRVKTLEADFARIEKHVSNNQNSPSNPVPSSEGVVADGSLPVQNVGAVVNDFKGDAA